MIVGRIVEEYSYAGGVYVRADPVCEQWLGGDPGDNCGKPATVRRNNWPYWSRFWCPEHAAIFDEPFPPMHADLREFQRRWLQDDLDIPTFVRRAS